MRTRRTIRLIICTRRWRRSRACMTPTSWQRRIKSSCVRGSSFRRSSTYPSLKALTDKVLRKWNKCEINLMLPRERTKSQPSASQRLRASTRACLIKKRPKANRQAISWRASKLIKSDLASSWTRCSRITGSWRPTTTNSWTPRVQTRKTRNDYYYFKSRLRNSSRSTRSSRMAIRPWERTSNKCSCNCKGARLSLEAMISLKETRIREALKLLSCKRLPKKSVSCSLSWNRSRISAIRSFSCLRHAPKASAQVRTHQIWQVSLTYLIKSLWRIFLGRRSITSSSWLSYLTRSCWKAMRPTELCKSWLSWQMSKIRFPLNS